MPRSLIFGMYFNLHIDASLSNSKNGFVPFKEVDWVSLEAVFTVQQTF